MKKRTDERFAWEDQDYYESHVTGVNSETERKVIPVILEAERKKKFLSVPMTLFLVVALSTLVAIAVHKNREVLPDLAVIGLELEPSAPAKPATDAVVEPAVKGAPAEAPELAVIGEPAALGRLRVSVRNIAVRELPEKKLFQMALLISVENASNAPIDTPVVEVLLRDVANRVYSSSSKEQDALAEKLLNPLTTLQSKWLFSVPTSAEIDRAELKSGAAITQIDLLAHAEVDSAASASERSTLFAWLDAPTPEEKAKQAQRTELERKRSQALTEAENAYLEAAETTRAEKTAAAKAESKVKSLKSGMSRLQTDYENAKAEAAKAEARVKYVEENNKNRARAGEISRAYQDQDRALRHVEEATAALEKKKKDIAQAEKIYNAAANKASNAETNMKHVKAAYDRLSEQP